nr:uncharacterized protein [Tanacetum cinerariifolium]
SNSSSCWGELPLELLRDVLTRIEVSESTWPMRRNVVLAGGVCKKWRSMVKDIVGGSDGSGMFTFPSDLKQDSVNDDNDSSNSSSCWGELPLELLRDVLTRIEVSESTWPMRRNVVLAGGVCKKWRSMVKDIVGGSDGSGMFTFPSDLKQAGIIRKTETLSSSMEKLEKIYSQWIISTPYQRFRHLQSVLAASTPSLHGMTISIRFGKLEENFQHSIVFCATIELQLVGMDLFLLIICFRPPLLNLLSSVNALPGIGDLQVVGGIKKLNNQNYNTWSICMASYLQGQDLWDVVDGNETTVEDDVLEHIRDAATSKVAWDTFTELFSKKNDTKLQLLESELLSVAKRDLTIAQYFHKVKTLCREISELDPDAPIGDTRMKRIIIHGLKLEFRSYVAAIQGWQNQPSLVELENLLASQEALIKQMGGVSIKKDEEALYANKGKGNFKQHFRSGSKKNDDKAKGHDDESSSRTGEARRVILVARSSH